MHVRCGAKSFKRFFGVAKRLRRHNSIIITMNPTEMPTICGRLRRKPKLAPDAINIRLFGPGVAELTKAKRTSAGRTSIFMRRDVTQRKSFAIGKCVTWRLHQLARTASELAYFGGCRLFLLQILWGSGGCAPGRLRRMNKPRRGPAPVPPQYSAQKEGERSGAADHFGLADNHFGLFDAGNIDQASFVDCRAFAVCFGGCHRGQNVACLCHGFI